MPRTLQVTLISQVTRNRNIQHAQNAVLTSKHIHSFHAYISNLPRRVFTRISVDNNQLQKISEIFPYNSGAPEERPPLSFNITFSETFPFIFLFHVNDLIKDHPFLRFLSLKPFLSYFSSMLMTSSRTTLLLRLFSQKPNLSYFSSM